jgi:hypothetical protein
MSRLSALAGLLLLLALGTAVGQNDNAKLGSLSYPELGKLVRSYKGKPVVVYVWAHY